MDQQGGDAPDTVGALSEPPALRLSGVEVFLQTKLGFCERLLVGFLFLGSSRGFLHLPLSGSQSVKSEKSSDSEKNSSMNRVMFMDSDHFHFDQ